MQRHLIGVFALSLLATGGTLLAVHGIGGTSATLQMFMSACIRVGLLLCGVWLAWPQLARLLARISPLTVGLLLVAILVLAWRPKLFVVIGPILLLAALLQMLGWFTKPQSSPSSRPRTNRSARPRGPNKPRQDQSR